MFNIYNNSKYSISITINWRKRLIKLTNLATNRFSQAPNIVFNVFVMTVFTKHQYVFVVLIHQSSADITLNKSVLNCISKCLFLSLLIPWEIPIKRKKLLFFWGGGGVFRLPGNYPIELRVVFWCFWALRLSPQLRRQCYRCQEPSIL